MCGVPYSKGCAASIAVDNRKLLDSLYEKYSVDGFDIVRYVYVSNFYDGARYGFF